MGIRNNSRRRIPNAFRPIRRERRLMRQITRAEYERMLDPKYMVLRNIHTHEDDYRSDFYNIENDNKIKRINTQSFQQEIREQEKTTYGRCCSPF